MPTRAFARVELYNLHEHGRPVGNGWLVAKVLPDGRRANTLRVFGRNEAEARAYAELWNGPELDAEVNGGSES